MKNVLLRLFITTIIFTCISLMCRWEIIFTCMVAFHSLAILICTLAYAYKLPTPAPNVELTMSFSHFFSLIFVIFSIAGLTFPHRIAIYLMSKVS